MYESKVFCRRLSCLSFVWQDDHPKAIFLIIGRMIRRCLFYLSNHQCLFKSKVNLPSTFVNITLVRSSKWAAVQLFPAPWKQAMLFVPGTTGLSRDQFNPSELLHLPCPVLLHPLNWPPSDQGAWRVSAASWGDADEPSVPLIRTPCSPHTLGFDAEVPLHSGWVTDAAQGDDHHTQPRIWNQTGNRQMHKGWDPTAHTVTHTL